MSETLLTEKNVEILIMSLASSRGDNGFNEEEAMKVVSWAEEACVNMALLENVLNGDVRVDIRTSDGELIFNLTDKGIEQVEGAEHLIPNVKESGIIH